jgi:hypothetical protein
MKKLISMTDFVLEQDTNWSYKNTIVSIRDYANFLKQPLELWMFVPCDEDGNVLEEPKDEGQTLVRLEKDFKEYQQAKERCLFEGFELKGENELFYNLTHDLCYSVFLSKNNKRTMQDLINSDFKLTPTALKQIGL